MDKQTHHLSETLPFGIKSQVQWSRRPNGKALLFVHGFGGGAITTWVQFPSLLLTEASCAGLDHIFYGYDALRTRARPSAAGLVTLLDQLFDNPLGTLPNSLPLRSRNRNFRYTHITLVAHSLGAVVSRLSLLDAHRKGRRWSKNTSLVLFAPAHKGANILAIASLAMGALRLAPVEALARFKFQVLHDLDEKSTTLSDLAARTKDAIANGATHLIAKRVVYAGADKIVNPHDFCDDPAAEFIQNASHVSVCKPSADFREPLLHLLTAL